MFALSRLVQASDPPEEMLPLMEEDRGNERRVMETMSAVLSPPSEAFNSNGSFEATFSTSQNLFYDPKFGTRQLVVMPSSFIGSGSSNYGIQALINNVHRGYVEDFENGVNHYDAEEISNAESSQPEESEILREWNRNKALELQERQRDSQAKQDRILEQAAIERETFYNGRAAQICAIKQMNREREKVYYDHIQSRQKVLESNSWEAVASLIDLDADSTVPTNGVKLETKPPDMVSSLPRPKSPAEVINTRNLDPKQVKEPPKPITTDLSRMKEILMKLKNQPMLR